MSIEAMRWVWKSSKAKGNDRLILLALADEANDEGMVTAYKRSYTALQNKTGLARSTVRGRVAHLVAIGDLVVLKTGAGREATDYRIAMPEPECAEIRHTECREPAPTVPISGTPSSPSSPVSPKTEFARFWDSYPRKTARGAAFRAWALAVRTNDPEKIIEGAKRFRDDPNREPTFTPHPATWLRSERWEDDPLPPKPKPATNGFAPPPHVSRPFAERKAELERERAARQEALERLGVE